MKPTIRLLEDADYDLNDQGEPEYDFAELAQRAKAEGREYHRQAAGRLVRIAPDIARVFPDEEAVNRALREFIASRAQAAQAEIQQPTTSN